MTQKVLTKDGYRIIELNRRKAIHLRCLDCSGWQSKDVKECPFENCALHPFRIFKSSQDAKDRSKAIRNYCKNCMNGVGHEVALCVSKYCSLHGFRRNGS